MKRVVGIEMTDFMRFGRASLSLSAVTMVVGANAQGKTTVRDAIEFALTGVARGLTKKKDVHGLAREGGSKLAVTLTMDGEDKLQRTERACSWTKERIEKEFGLPTEYVGVALDPWRIIRMTPDARLGVLRAISGGVEDDEIAALLRKDMGEEQAKQFALLARQDLKRAENECVARRREAKRAVDENTRMEPCRTITVICAGGEETWDLAELHKSGEQEQLTKMREAVSKMRFEVGSAKLLQSTETLEAEIAKLGRAIEQRKQKAKHEAGRLQSVEMVGHRADIEAGRKATLELSEVERDLAALETALEASRAETTEARAHAERISMLERSGKCSVFGGACPLAASELAGHREQAAAMLAACRNKEQSIERRMEELREKKKALMTTIELGKGAANTLQDMEKKVDELLRESGGESVGEVGALSGKLKELLRELDSARNAERLKEQLSAAEADLERREMLHTEVVKYVAEHAAWKEAQVRRARAEREAERWNRAAAALAEDGPVAQLLARNASLDGVGKAAKPLMPGRELRLGQDGSILLNGRPIELASRSEQYRVGVVVSAFIARRAKCPLFVVDEVDILHGPALTAMHVFLKSLTEWFGTVVICGTCAVDRAPKSNRVAGQAVYVIERGEIRENV